ncbi:hypothetical protein C8Q76DRAFT_691244 [Earliella scabrosa]|nr:hypothetical protein C8Q76DRAFT_691244 [Earliella scabrosa]
MFNSPLWSLSHWLAHVPKEVIAKNLHMSQAAFDHIPGQELYIFPARPAVRDDTDQKAPYGPPPEPFTFDFANITAVLITIGPTCCKPTHHPGGTVKIVSVADWIVLSEGDAQITLFAVNENARTFDYQGGDIAYVPATQPPGAYTPGDATSVGLWQVSAISWPPRVLLLVFGRFERVLVDDDENICRLASKLSKEIPLSVRSINRLRPGLSSTLLAASCPTASCWRDLDFIKDNTCKDTDRGVMEAC